MKLALKCTLIYAYGNEQFSKREEVLITSWTDKRDEVIFITRTDNKIEAIFTT